MAITTANLTTKIRADLKDPNGNKYDDAWCRQAINEAVRGVVRRIAATRPEFWLRTGETQLHTANIVNGTANYDLPSDFFVALMVTAEDSDGNVDPLDVLTLERTLDADANGYILRDDDIYLYSTPDANVADGLNVYYISRPTEVTADANPVPMSDDFEDAIELYAVIKGKARESEGTGDFAAFFRKVEESLDLLVAKTNAPTDDGMHVEHRIWS